MNGLPKFAICLGLTYTKNAEKLIVHPKDQESFSLKLGNIWCENKKNQKQMLLTHKKSCHDKLLVCARMEKDSVYVKQNFLNVLSGLLKTDLALDSILLV